MKAFLAPCLVATALSTLAGGPALADCRALVDAANKLDSQPRFATWEVKNPEQALGEPDFMLIGTVIYSREGKEWRRLDAAADIAAFRKEWREKGVDGTLRCAPAGSGTLRGASVSKIRYYDVGEEADAMVVWIDRRTGLPVFLPDDPAATAGTLIRYGDAVREPKGPVKPLK